MLTNIIKFIHILYALGLLGAVFYCLGINLKNRTINFQHVSKRLFGLGIGALITGSLLVYPKDFTFHTPWIKAAFVLMSIFFIVVGFLYLYQKPLAKKASLLSTVIWGSLVILLVIVVHDAVTKTTFIF